MNPTNNLYQSLLINAVSNKADIQVLLESCEDYMNLLAELKNRLKISIFLWRKSCASR